MKFVKTSNYNDRKNGLTPRYIVLHYTGMQSAEDALDRMCDPQAQVSAHYMVGENGDLWQLVPEDKRAWHAGVSYWRGITDMNSASIGIEIVNKGHEWGYHPFPQAQMEAVKLLCQQIMQRHNIPPENVIAHSDIAPARKTDPGELFPWQDFAQNGIGVWPETQVGDVSEDQALKALHTFGYNPAEPAKNLWQAFHRRFYPERLDQKPDQYSFQLAQGLLRFA